MKMNRYPRFTRVSCVLCLCIILVLLTGFTFPQPIDIKRQLQEKWQLFIAKTPGGKELQQWREVYAQTRQAMQSAREAGADRYAPEKMHGAEEELNTAIGYAKEQGYKKAVSYAKKAREAAEAALADTMDVKTAKVKQLQKNLSEMEVYVLNMSKSNQNNQANHRQDDAVLYLSDIRHAVVLEQFDDAALMVDAFKKEFMN